MKSEYMAAHPRAKNNHKKLCNLFNLCYNILRIPQERIILNEKILTLAAGALLVVGMASCSNKIIQVELIIPL